MDFRWKLHRKLTSHGYVLPQRRRAKTMLFLSQADPISHAQIFPFVFFRRQLASLGIQTREVSLSRFVSKRFPKISADIICLQTWFDLSSAQMQSLIKNIKTEWPDVPIIYFDWFAPTDLRYAEILDPCVVGYVKKQVLRDFAIYGTQTIGDTNLSDYYSRLFGLDLPRKNFVVPTSFREKIIVGSGFEYSERIASLLVHEPQFHDRSIDLHARISVSGTAWYSAMREHALIKASSSDGSLASAIQGRVPTKRFYSELRQSKLCFSPFGYGEICWRDFEAMCTGALLIKPDVSHLCLSQKFFISRETYIPVSWDFRDLNNVVEYYVAHKKEREEIARNAFVLIKKQYDSADHFLQVVDPIIRILKR